MEVHTDGGMIRKGPWSAEEDEVLINYVKKYGPRDWSSIRSKGLLPRTGKSCRLRYVNKLKPNLKTGCKFSPEEERVVIELQAQFGNKWARIATHLPGRTDNDVKNFWSTRRKRLERILQTTSSKSQKNRGKKPVHQEMPMEVPTTESFIPTGEEESSSSFCKAHCRPPSYFWNAEMFQMVPLPDLVKPSSLNWETDLPTLEATPINMLPLTEASALPLLPQLPQPQLNLPLLPVCQELIPGPGDVNFLDMLEHQETAAIGSGQKCEIGLPPFGFEGSAQNGGQGNNENPAMPDSFFDNFPTDMFDYLEPLPSSSE